MVRLVGRGREAAALQRAVAGAGGVAVVSGEPGIGKTTLAREVAAAAAERGVAVLWGRGVESAPVYWPWLQVLRDRGDAVGDTALRGEVGSGADVVVRVAPDLASRLSVDARSAGGDEKGGRVRLFAAFERWLRAAAAGSGLLVVLDDMHWADRASLRLLEYVAEGLPASRVLVLVAYRSTERGDDDVVGDLDALPAVTRLDLGGLAVDAVHEQLVAIDRSTVDPAVSARVHALTGGNPLFVSELGRLLAEDVAAGRPIDDTWPREVPTTVRALIRRRLGRLRPSTRELLCAAAVAGREFPVAVVAAMVGAPAIVCLDELDAARAAGLVKDGGAPGRLRFVHALVRDAVVADASTADRVRLHRAAADALEATVDRQVQPSVIAAHLGAAASLDQRDPRQAVRAARWAARAADEAMRRLAWEEAARLGRLALDVGGSALGDVERCGLLLGVARALAHAGDLTGSLAVCRQVADLAHAIARPELAAEAALVLTDVGDPVLSRGLQRLAEQALEAIGNDRVTLRARLLAQLAEAHLYQHDEERADACSRMALAHAEAAGDRATLLVALRARRLATLSPAALDETLALADRVLELVSAASPEDTRHAFWAHVWRIQTWFVRGRLDLVADELLRAGVVADELGEPVIAAQLLRLRVILAATRGAFGDATDMAAHAYTAMRRAGQTIADAQHAGFRASIGRFVGYPPDLADAVALPVDAAGPFAAMGRVRAALVLAGLGRVDDAAAEYRRLDPVASWRLPSYLRLTAWTLRLRLAVALAVPADIAALVDLLAPHRGLHAGGGLSYDGPVELAVATGAAALGDLNDATADLQVALMWSRGQGARPFVAEAAVALAEVLARRAGPGDVEQAATLLDEADTMAAQLDMTPVAARVRRLRAGLGLDRSGSPLSVRELQVARLLARGLTNRQVAETLVVSQRTAENHVQHILTKLGLTNRTQVAAWVATHPTPGPE